MSPRTSEQNEKVRSESINRILGAALKLIAKNGFETTSIAQIAKEAEVSKGLMYNYFDSKEDLLKAIISNVLEEGEKLMINHLSDDPVETLANVFKWFFNDLRSHREEWKLFAEITFKVNKFDFVQELMRGKLREYVELISSLLEQIGIKHPYEEALIITALFDGIGIQYLATGQEYPLDRMEKHLVKKYCNK